MLRRSLLQARTRLPNLQQSVRLASSSSWRQSGDFRWFLPIQTRWRDNDSYGHVNNAVYHSMFDTAINVYLLRHCGQRLQERDSDDSRGFMVHTECDYFRAIAYPGIYLCGVAVSKLGNTSVDYKVGLFEQADPDRSATGSELDFVRGHFSNDGPLPDAFTSSSSVCLCRYTHVFVDTKTERPVRMEGQLREGLQKILAEAKKD